MIVLAKFIHIASIAIWAAGLLCLPFLFAQRRSSDPQHEAERLHGLVRFFYVVILSPAAFIAIGSGTALIFLRQTFEIWFQLKLVAVGIMVLIHLLSGLTLLALFSGKRGYTRPHYVLYTGSTLAAVTAILVLVSAKPAFHALVSGGEMFSPGWLGAWLGPLIGWEPR